MTLRTKLLLIFFVLSFYVVQIWHTVYNRINWPFCSHNFYYHRSPLVKDLFRIILEDNTGRLFSVDPRHTLPIEGYRCGSIFREIFITNFNLEKKQAFSKLLLERLNQGGWEGFDERFTAAVPMPGHKFVGLQVERHWIDTSKYAKTQTLPVVKKETLYQYKE
jgi:hypothetical protein